MYSGNMVEHRCDKCPYIAPNKAALKQHSDRKTPCNSGKFACRQGCGKTLKSTETRRNHEKGCSGPETTREELQAQLTNQEETNKLNMALVSHATTSAVTKLVCNIQSNPEKVLDVSQLELHHAVGKEATEHLRGRNIGDQLSSFRSVDVLVRWFWLLRGDNLSHNHNILLMHGDLAYAVICNEEGWKTYDTEAALLVVFRADVTKLYNFLGTDLENTSKRVEDFKNDFVLHTVMAELMVSESKGPFFSRWKQAITEPLSILTMQLYGTEVKKPFASTMEHSRQQTFASNLQEIKKKREMRHQLEQEEALLEEENRVLFVQQGPTV